MVSNRLTDLLGTRLPIIQAPMAGANDDVLAVAVSRAGALGSLPCAISSAAKIRHEVRSYRAQSHAPLNLNFFCHEPPKLDSEIQARFLRLLAPFYEELGLPLEAPISGAVRRPFDEEACELVEVCRPEVVSFHFGLPDAPLLERVRATGASILASATSVAEAKYLEAHGCDAIVAQGAEAGGHRGMFLSYDVGSQIGTFALLPLVADTVRVPVIAAGGIADARGVKAAFVLGASGVQVGTAFLRCPESIVSGLFRAALANAGTADTRLTNLFTGRPARGLHNRLIRELGALNSNAPRFPLASAALAPLRARAEALGSSEFSLFSAGQAVPLAREVSAAEVVRNLALGCS